MSVSDVLDYPRNKNRGEKVKINNTFSAADGRRRAADKQHGQSALSLRWHLQCIRGKQLISSIYKQKQAISYLEANSRVVHAEREPDLSAV